MSNFLIENEVKIKNAILKKLASISGFLGVSSMKDLSKDLKIDFDVCYVLVKRLESDGHLEIDSSTHIVPDHIVSLTLRGSAFLKNGGYKSPSCFFVVIRTISKYAIVLIMRPIGTIIVGLITALILYYLFGIG
jgi:hypothetical protein